MGEKHATLIQVAEPGESKRLFTPLASEKVEYLGISARGKNGEILVGTKRDPFESHYSKWTSVGEGDSSSTHKRTNKI